MSQQNQEQQACQSGQSTSGYVAEWVWVRFVMIEVKTPEGREAHCQVREEKAEEFYRRLMSRHPQLIAEFGSTSDVPVVDEYEEFERQTLDRLR